MKKADKIKFMELTLKIDDLKNESRKLVADMDRLTLNKPDGWKDSMAIVDSKLSETADELIAATIIRNTLLTTITADVQNVVDYLYGRKNKSLKYSGKMSI